MNLAVYGLKLWLIVDVLDTERFESWVRSIWGKTSGYDDQWLAHLNLILPPSMLEAANIKFNLICAGPGDMVIISPNQYHYVVNTTTSLAVTVNFLFPHEAIAKKPTLLCEDCGLYPLVGKVANLAAIALPKRMQVMAKTGNANIARPDSSPFRKRRRIDEQGELISSNGEDDVDEDEEDARRSATIKRLQAQPASCLVPAFSQKNPPKANILRLAMAMRGHKAIAQIWELRQSIRDSPSAEFNSALMNRKLTGDALQPYESLQQS
ncbi:putative transcription factor jumonji [Trichoderma cornu-damae]|uniref:Transcription factor jumonji n=1 Tax=Trichoderma cornu-damae TaxID=654480 RepID=A0A9P8QK24_9HYPO|nr:putative transcription factor jumonji [Trichoderma cornu-damae]